MNGGDDQELNIGEFRVDAELQSRIGHMNHDHRNVGAMKSIYEKNLNCETQSPPKPDNENDVFRRDVPVAASTCILRRRIGANGAQDGNRLEGPELRRTGVEEDDKAENLGPLRAFHGSEVRVSPRNRNGSDVEFADDDGGSSVCSENVYGSGGDLVNLPGDAPPHSKWGSSTWDRNSKLRGRRERESSVIESLEKQRRESVESRLKELRIPNKRHSSVSSSSSLLSPTTPEMPIIAKLKSTKNATLPKQMRRASYQSVIVTPSFFAPKSGGLSTAVNRPLLLGLGSEMRERRGSLVSRDLQTPPIGSASDTESFPLRAAGSLSCIETSYMSPRNVVSSKLMGRPLASDVKTRKSDDDDALESSETLKNNHSSSISALIQTSMLDRWSDVSQENGFLNNHPAPHPAVEDSFSGPNNQIRDPNRPDFTGNSGDASEIEQDGLRNPEDLPRRQLYTKTDSPIGSREICSVNETLLLPAENYRPLLVETMETQEKNIKGVSELKGVSAGDRLPEKLLNGNYSFKSEFCSDKSSDASSTDNDDKHYKIKNLVHENLQTSTCREEDSTPGSPAFSLQTSSTPQEAFPLNDHQSERELMAPQTNAGFELVLDGNSANQNKVPVYPAFSKKYCSDIQIQVTEVKPVFPVTFGQSSNGNAACSEESRDGLLIGHAHAPIDDDVERVSPNWSSYPGPLPGALRSSDLDDLNTTSKPAEEVKSTIKTPERSVSTLEINLQPASTGEREKTSKKEASQRGRPKYDSSYDAYESKVTAVHSAKDVDADFRRKFDSSERRKRVIVQNVTREVDALVTPQRSVERNEIFVMQDPAPATARTLTLPRNYRSRSWNRFESQARGLGSSQQELSYSPKQEFSYSPKQEFSYSPKQEFSYSPKQEFSYSPKQELSYSPKQEFNYSPKQELCYSPKQEFSYSSKQEFSYSPKPELSYSPNPELSYTPKQGSSSSPKQELADGVVASTPDDLSVEIKSPGANVTRITFYSKKDEQRTRSRDGERTRSSLEAIGGISTSGDNCWQTSVVRREDRWKDSRMETGRSPEKTPSVERIWETLEQPRTRLTKRNVRLESDSSEVVVGSRVEKPRQQYVERSRVVINGGGTGEGKVVEGVVVRSTSLQDQVTEVSTRGGGGSLMDIEVLKGGLGLGFCIEGGKDGPYGDRPITVKRLFRGSSDSKFSSGARDSLRAGDEILSANGRDMTLLSRFVAWNFLKTLPEGIIKLVIRRRTPQPDSNQPQPPTDMQ